MRALPRASLPQARLCWWRAMRSSNIPMGLRRRSRPCVTLFRVLNVALTGKSKRRLNQPASMYPERQNRTLTYFVEGLHTLNTNMQPLRLTVDHDRALKHVGAELTIG